MKHKILGLFIAGIISTPLTVIADSQYPAANFQPKVIFSDASAISSGSTGQSSSFDPDYPAANFQPKILFIDASAANSGFQGGKSSYDPKYPATYFTPKVIYP